MLRAIDGGAIPNSCPNRYLAKYNQRQRWTGEPVRRLYIILIWAKGSKIAIEKSQWKPSQLQPFKKTQQRWENGLFEHGRSRKWRDCGLSCGANPLTFDHLPNSHKENIEI